MKISKPFFCIAALLSLLLVGCKSKNDQTAQAFGLLSKDLWNAGYEMKGQVDMQLSKLQAKLGDARTYEKMKLYKPEIDLIDSTSKKITRFIEKLNDELLTKAMVQDGNASNGDSSYKLDNTSAVEEVFQKNHRAAELYDTLIQYGQNILAVSPEIRKEFTYKFERWLDVPDSVHGGRDNFEKLFDKATTVQVAALLSKYMYDVTRIEYKLLQYYDNNVTVEAITFDVYRPVFNQNVNYAKPGQDMQISAGLAAINSKSDPVISFNGKNVPLEDFMATYNFKASKKEGMNLNHIEINFKDQYGRGQVIVADVPYTVVKDSCSTN